MRSAPASAPVRDWHATAAHLRGVAAAVAAHVHDEPEHQQRDASLEERAALEAEWAMHRAREARATPILNAMNECARQRGMRDWRFR